VKKLFGILGISILILLFFFLPFKDALQLSIILISIYLFVKIFSFLLRKILWKIRNKLILSYFFVAIIPLILFIFLSYFLVSFLFGEYGNYIFTNTLQNRLNFLERVVNLNREDYAKRLNIIKIKDKNKIEGFKKLLSQWEKRDKKDLSKGLLVYKGDKNESSIFLYYYNKKDIYIWKISKETLDRIREATLWKSTFIIKRLNLNKNTLNNTDLENAKTISELKTPLRIAQEEESKLSKLLKFKWINIVKVINLDKIDLNTAIIILSFDIKLAKQKFKTTLLSGTLLESQKALLFVLFSITLILSFLYLLSFILGIILAKSITSSISNLYIGTKKLIEKNFQYRITKIPSDQLGEVAMSFNSMAESIEQLLKEEKEKERLKRELELATKMQKKLLPADDLRVGTFIFSGLSITAQEVGGDYYDYFKEGERIFFSIADVAGKGMPAAFYMAEIKGIIRSIAHSTKKLKEIVEEINYIIHNSIEKISFVTAIIGYLDISKNELRYIRCGHPLPIKVSSSKKVEEIFSEGIALGIRESIKEHIEEKAVKLQVGETFVFYTDGLSEMRDEEGKIYGAKRIVSLFEEEDVNNVKDFKRIIKEGVYSFIGNNYIDDDITILIIRNHYGKKTEKI